MRPDPAFERLLDDCGRRVDAAYADLVARIDRSRPLEFATLWSAFADWFRVPVDGVAPRGDGYEFYAGFIDGDPERESMEFEPPPGLEPPLAVVELARQFKVADKQESTTSWGVGAVGFTFHYELTDAWRALADEPYWTNPNPLGWASHGTADDREASLAWTESSIAHRLASSAPFLRAEVFSTTRDEGVVFEPGG